ncbi:MAG: CoA ester lyase [Burkholderiales bacterium]|nr:CoA ester lyase [Burkholderiales bacterium]MDE2286863.1 CoA ester lyase [Burkholderiales bacterium]MDE2610487.1 CoA ester lyase [Burkholderiales bacterium]
MKAHARTYLFVPGNRPERFDKAVASAADVVVIDLEDAVAASAKSEARDRVMHWSAQLDTPMLDRIALRINDPQSEPFPEDLRLVRESRIRLVMLPKAEHAEHVDALVSAVPDVSVLPLLETARALAHCRAIAGASGVVRLVFGTLDFALDLELDITDDPQPLAEAAASITLASRLAQLSAPVAGVTPQIDDEARLLADWSWFWRRGFGAKLCIHPRQIAPLHAAMAPDAASLAWARRVVAADAAGTGAASVDGQMVDRPVVLRAWRMLRRAGL